MTDDLPDYSRVIPSPAMSAVGEAANNLWQAADDEATFWTALGEYDAAVLAFHRALGSLKPEDGAA